MGTSTKPRLPRCRCQPGTPTPAHSGMHACFKLPTAQTRLPRTTGMSLLVPACPSPLLPPSPAKNPQRRSGRDLPPLPVRPPHHTTTHNPQLPECVWVGMGVLPAKPEAAGESGRRSLDGEEGRYVFCEVGDLSASQPASQPLSGATGSVWPCEWSGTGVDSQQHPRAVPG